MWIGVNAGRELVILSILEEKGGREYVRMRIVIKYFVY